MKAEKSRRGDTVKKKRLSEQSLAEFTKHFWAVLEPKRPLVWGWVLDAICDHLEAVTNGDINRLLINVPPGCTKSLMTDVIWPAWEWGPQDHPDYRYLSFSYSSGLTWRDNGRFLKLVTHPDYVALWGSKFDVTRKAIKKVENDRTGWKQASSVGGIGTGERGDRVIIDDPNNVKKSESKKVLEDTNQWLTEVMPDRLNNQAESSIVLIQQRTNEIDCSGTLLALEKADYVHLCIPMKYDARRTYHNILGYNDPRTEDGELAWPERFPADEVEKLEHIKGAFAFAGQYQQSPVPRGGGILKRDWWQLYPPEGEQFTVDGKPLKPLEYPPMDYIVASLDTAMTESEENDWSAMTVWGSYRDENNVPKLLLMEAWQVRLAFRPLVEKIIKTCRTRHVDRLIVEGKSGGHYVGQEITRLCSEEEFGVTLLNPRMAGGDKWSRANAVAHLFENGIVCAPERGWSEMVIGECEVFPKGQHDDLVDTVTQALWFMRKSGVALLRDELEPEGEAYVLPSHRQPLYDV